MIRAALELCSRWVVFEPNTPHTRATLTAAISRLPQPAVDAGRAGRRERGRSVPGRLRRHQQSVDDTGVGPAVRRYRLAPSMPFEFVLLRLGRSDDSLDVQERGAARRGERLMAAAQLGSIRSADPLLGYQFPGVDHRQPAGCEQRARGQLARLAGDQATAGFSEISGPRGDHGGRELRRRRQQRRRRCNFPGRIKWANLVFKRGVLRSGRSSDTSDFWTWLQSFLDGQGVRKDGTITLHGRVRRSRLWRGAGGAACRRNGPARR